MKYVFLFLSMFSFTSCLVAKENTDEKDLIDMDLVLVEAGTFLMGSDEPDKAFERPAHQVIISQPFFISRYEMTNKQVVVAYNWGLANGYVEVNADGVFNASGKSRPLLDIYDQDCRIVLQKNRFAVQKAKENFPCIEISWYGAAVFCNILNLMTGRQELYELSQWTCNYALAGYRLPTESEWEYAACGGKKSQGYVFAGSNTLDTVGWFEENSNKEIHPVGRKKPNELGICDMSGNVWEWCGDWHSPIYYFFSSGKDPVGPVTGKTRVIRGGSWNWGELNARNKSRLLSCEPSGMGDLGGFRVVRSVD